MRLAFLAPYPVSTLAPHIEVVGDASNEHPATWIPELIGSLVQFTDHELHLLTYSDLVGYDQFAKIDQVHFHILKRPRMKYRLASFFMLDRAKFGARLRTIEPDIVHGHGTDSTYGYVTTRCGFPYIITIQGILSQILPTWKDRGVVDRMVSQLLLGCEKKTIEEGKAFIANTAYVEEFVKESNRQAEIYTIENVVQDIYFQANGQSFAATDYILFIGTISKSKGVEDLIRAFYAVKSAKPDLKLKIIGYGDEEYFREVIVPLISSFDLTGSIEFCGKRPAAYIAKMLEQALCLVVPSHVEQAPQAIAEAMAVGVPVVATSVGGIPDMLEDGVTGVLCPAKCDRDLAEKILLLANDRELCVKMGRSAKSVAAERYNSHRVALKLDAAYRRVAGC